MNWQTIVIAAICAILLAGYGLLRNRDDTTDAAVTTMAQPGYYAKDATIVETGENGLPRFSLHAEHIEQVPTSNSIALDDVSFNYQAIPNSPWLLKAQHGNIMQGNRVATFTGAVSIQPQGATVKFPLVLRTEKLNIDTMSNLAHAPGKVSIEMNQQVLTAIGLQADLTRQTVHLESQVHGEFALH